MGFMLYTGLARAGWDRLGLRRAPLRLGVTGAMAAALGAHMAGGWQRIDYGLNMKVCQPVCFVRCAAGCNCIRISRIGILPRPQTETKQRRSAYHAGRAQME